MDHLGERLSALVDGELGHAERDRALGHLAMCETCRFEAEMLRRLKRRLHQLDAPEPSHDFMGRLSAMTESSPAGPPSKPPSSGGLGSSPPLGSSRPIGGGLPRRPSDGGALAVAEPVRPAAHEPAPPRRGRTVRPLSVLRPPWGRARYAVPGVSALALAIGTAFAAGGESPDAPVVTPPLDDYAVEHAVTARQAAIPQPESHATTAVTFDTPAEEPAPVSSQSR